MTENDADDPILDPLNPQQRKAVEHTEGPLLILAGAGTGKTRTMTHRIAYLIDRMGVPPDRILGVTFTNKAADEMAERTLNLIPDAVVQPELRTFHSWGNSFLREEVEHDFFDFKRPFTIYDQEQQKALLKEIIKGATGIDEDDYKPSGIASFISKRKADLETAEMYQKRDDLDKEGHELGHMYRVYQEELRDNNAVDFGDLIMLPVLLMQHDRDVLSSHQGRYDYLMVDEFQDTNYAQYKLTHLLGREHQNVAVVGDDDQSIYSWRGADVGNILNRFEKDFPGTKTVKLEQNYRSTGAILDAAYDVIKNQEERKDKKMWTEREEGEPPAVRRFKDEQEEARFIRRRINRLVDHEGYDYGDFGILVRMTAQTRPLEEQFLKNDIPYVVIGSMRFLERKEIKDIMAYLYMLVNPEDESSIKRIINTPTRGIGSKTEELVFDYADANDCSPITAIRKLVERDDIGGRARNSLQGFYDLYRNLREAAKESSPADLIDAVLEKTQYMDEEVRKKDDEEMIEQRASNIDELKNMARRYEEETLQSGTTDEVPEDEQPEDDTDEADEVNKTTSDSADDEDSREDETDKPTLSGFLTELTLYSDVDVNEPKDDAVNVMTYHAAKGLEFPVVFLPGLEQGILPHSRSIGRPDALAEERRLCYVGLTRAEDQLYCTLTKKRFLHGSHTRPDPSEFLKEAGLWADEDERKRRQRQNDEEFLSDTPADETGGDVDRTENNDDLSAGDWVEHKKLGRGKILRITQQDSDEVAVIDFQNDSQAERKLVLEYAPLDPADPPF